MADALVAFDDSSAGLLAAKGTTVAAFDAGGALRWESDIGTEIAALTDMGEATGVALSTTDEDGGRFMVLGEADGAVRTSVRTPSAARALDVSGNGEVLAVTLERDVHYFELLGE